MNCIRVIHRLRAGEGHVPDTTGARDGREHRANTTVPAARTASPVSGPGAVGPAVALGPGSRCPVRPELIC